jgi:hypothetical protein
MTNAQTFLQHFCAPLHLNITFSLPAVGKQHSYTHARGSVMISVSGYVIAEAIWQLPYCLPFTSVSCLLWWARIIILFKSITQSWILSLFTMRCRANQCSLDCFLASDHFDVEELLLTKSHKYTSWWLSSHKVKGRRFDWPSFDQVVWFQVDFFGFVGSYSLVFLSKFCLRHK